MAQTGMETAEILKGIIQETRPDFLIVVDALAARSIRRLGTTIQLTDTGIRPGSGVGNHRQSLTKESLGIPVLAVGVPTVVGAAAIVYDTVDAMTGTLKKNRGYTRTWNLYGGSGSGGAVSFDPGTSGTGVWKPLCNTAGYG